MSLTLTNFICSAIMSIMGLIVVREISGSKQALLKQRVIVLMLLLIIIPVFMHTDEYSYLYTPLIYLMTIFTYKEIFGISLIKSTISCGIMMFALFFLDAVASLFTTLFIPINEVRQISWFNITANIVFAIILIFIFTRNKLKKKLPIFVNKLEGKKPFKIIVTLIVVLITFGIIIYTFTRQVSVNKIFTTNMLLFMVFYLLVVVLLGERNNFETLSDEYDNLLNYVQIFEDWIEKEQLTRHEYKNQLAVLRIMTKEKRVRDKIDSITDDFINIDNDTITQLKGLPNGGIKGLLYYKMSISKKEKIEITVDVDKNINKKLSKISDSNMKVLTKLLGIYIDNAIEAARETRKKLVTIEFYESNEKINIVISNSYDINKDISNRSQKGFSTKGNGRGNGLYFARKLLSTNDWLEERQEIVKDLYIQKLIINISTKKKK